MIKVVCTRNERAASTLGSQFCAHHLGPSNYYGLDDIPNHEDADTYSQQKPLL